MLILVKSGFDFASYGNYIKKSDNIHQITQKYTYNRAR